jgi:hypothetical protein
MATPILTDSFGSLPSFERLSQMRRATKFAGTCPVSGSTSENSLPPNRAEVSIFRLQMHKTSASRQAPALLLTGETIIDPFQPVHVKKQKSELTRRALRTLDLGVNGFHQLSVVGQTGQRVVGRLLTQMIVELALLGDVLNDYLVGGLLRPNPKASVTIRKVETIRSTAVTPTRQTAPLIGHL